MAALLGGQGEATATQEAPPPAVASLPSDHSVVEVLATFAQRFECHVADEAHLEPSGGKVLLPHSCLAAFAMGLGELPATLLLRLTFHESSVCVGVADFVDDRQALELMRSGAAGGGSAPPPPRWGAGALAAVLVPRWVRSTLGCAEGDHVGVAMVSLPKASGLVLQPQTDEFVRQVMAQGDDPRDVLTALLNRLTAVSVGDVLSLRVGGERHAVDVLAVRGLPAVRCGRPGAQGFDVGAALRAAQGSSGGGGVLVRAACIVDADVELDFAESCESEGATARAQVAAAEEHRRREEARAAEEAHATAAADPWSAANAGEGHVLGDGGPDASVSDAGLSEREKRLAALERRGLG